MKILLMSFIILFSFDAVAQIDIDAALFGESKKNTEQEKESENPQYQNSEGKIDVLVIEENKKLSPVSYYMGDEFVASLGADYAGGSYVEMDDFTNEMKIIGTYEKNGTILRYQFNRNLSDTFLISDYLEGDYSQNVSGKVKTLSGEEDVDIRKFSIKAISSQPYFTYIDAKNKKLLLLTHIGPFLSLRIEAEGPDYFAVAKKFIDSLLDFKEQKAIVGDTGRVQLKHLKYKIRSTDKTKNLLNQIEK